jgi:hypothetical protein
MTKDLKLTGSDVFCETPLIGILCWETEGCPRGLEQLEELPGNSTNPKTFKFPVKYRRVKGANIHTILENPCQSALRAMIREARLVEEEGLRAITTSCGFNALFQSELADSVRVPVFTSSLMQIPLIQKMLKKVQTIGVITAKKSSLTERHLKNVGIDDEILLHIEGLESCTEWNKIFLAPEEDIDISMVEKDIVDIACSMKKTSDIGAFVLECTDLPPFSDAIRKATDCPVFDFVTLTNFVYRALKGG